MLMLSVKMLIRKIIIDLGLCRCQMAAVIFRERILYELNSLTDRKKERAIPTGWNTDRFTGFIIVEDLISHYCHYLCQLYAIVSSNQGRPRKAVPKPKNKDTPNKHEIDQERIFLKNTFYISFFSPFDVVRGQKCS